MTRHPADLLTAQEVAAILGMGVSTLSASIRRGDIPPPCKVIQGGARLWTWGMIRDAINRQADNAAGRLLLRREGKLPRRRGRPRRIWILGADRATGGESDVRG